jgi:hypothetical protein
MARPVEIELQALLETTAELKLPDGRARAVRHGYSPVHKIATGIGAIEIARPKGRDRGASGADRIRFTSAILPLWAQRKSLDTLLPILGRVRALRNAICRRGAMSTSGLTASPCRLGWRTTASARGADRRAPEGRKELIGFQVGVRVDVVDDARSRHRMCQRRLSLNNESPEGGRPHASQ